jgi:hypothetical protein
MERDGMTTKKVRPRAGIILAGIPTKGADVDAALADEWIANGLVVEVKPSRPSTGSTRDATAAKGDSKPGDTPAERG